jgi:hypothetical protein
VACKRRSQACAALFIGLSESRLRGVSLRPRVRFMRHLHQVEHLPNSSTCSPFCQLRFRGDSLHILTWNTFRVSGTISGNKFDGVDRWFYLDHAAFGDNYAANDSARAQKLVEASLHRPLRNSKRAGCIHLLSKIVSRTILVVSPVRHV